MQIFDLVVSEMQTFFMHFCTVLLGCDGVQKFCLAFLNNGCTFLSTCSEEICSVSTHFLLTSVGICAHL